MDQLITVRPDGSVLSLHPRTGRGLDLRKLGQAVIDRATLIEFDEAEQAWAIRWTESGAGKFDSCQSSLGPWTIRNLVASGMTPEAIEELLESKTARVATVGGPLLFRDYEDAVAVEVATIQSHQLSGNSR